MWSVFVNGVWQPLASDDAVLDWINKGWVGPDTPILHETWPRPARLADVPPFQGALPQPAPIQPAPIQPAARKPLSAFDKVLYSSLAGTVLALPTGIVSWFLPRQGALLLVLLVGSIIAIGLGWKKRGPRILAHAAEWAPLLVPPLLILACSIGVSLVARSVRSSTLKNAVDRCSQTECTKLGDDYKSGTTVPKDLQRAVELYNKACSQGAELGCVRLAELYAFGQGVPVDEKQAVALYEKACKYRVASACENAAAMYESGVGVTADPKKASALRLEAKKLDGGPDKEPERGDEPSPMPDREQPVADRSCPRLCDDNCLNFCHAQTEICVHNSGEYAPTECGVKTIECHRDCVEQCKKECPVYLK